MKTIIENLALGLYLKPNLAVLNNGFVFDALLFRRCRLVPSTEPFGCYSRHWNLSEMNPSVVSI